MEKNKNINESYTRHYATRNHLKVYPTEFVVRILLAKYRDLHYRRPKPGDSILDIAFGDGRNTALLCDMGLDVSGIEITQEIVDHTSDRLSKLGYHANLQVGRNSQIPFPDETFHYILSCHACYYCDKNQTLEDNLREYSRVLKPQGVLIASVADRSATIFDGAEELEDGTLLIKSDPYKNRIGYRLQAFSSKEAIRTYFSPFFTNCCFGTHQADYFGFFEKLFWVVCEKVGEE